MSLRTREIGFSSQCLNLMEEKESEEERTGV
jgi:hypothetical protein